MPNPEISKIQLPSGNTYDIKDAVARQMIAGGVSFIIAWNGTGTPDESAIPEGVQIRIETSTSTPVDYTWVWDGTMPVSALTNSDCPLPSIPAIHTISPERT